MSSTLAQAFSEAKPSGIVLIGITGGIGSGKSAVANELRDLGETVLSADAISKEVLKIPEVQKAISEVFEVDVFSNGALDTASLAALVFGNTEEHRENLEVLNSIVHPFVIEAMLEQLQALHAAGHKTVYNESALIYEAGFDGIYDYIVSVTADEKIRLQRLTGERGLSLADAQARMANQMSQDEKDKLADFTIANNGTLEQLRDAVGNLHVILSFLEPRTLDEDDE